MTHHLTNAIGEPSDLPDTQEVVGILLSELFRNVMFILCESLKMCLCV